MLFSNAIIESCFEARWQWHTPLIPALGRQRQAGLFEFEASMVYKKSSRTVRVTQRNPVSKFKQTNKSCYYSSTFNK